jgi:hypothetical protein
MESPSLSSSSNFEPIIHPELPLLPQKEIRERSGPGMIKVDEGGRGDMLVVSPTYTPRNDFPPS